MEIFKPLIQLLLLWILTLYIQAILKRSKKLPPGPLPFPILGNLLLIGTKPHKSLAKLAKLHGPIMSIQLGSVTTIVISSAAMAREVLQKNDAFFSGRTPTAALSVLNHAESSLPMLPPNSRWRTLRKICNCHVFAISRLDATTDLRRRKVQEMVSHVDDCCQAGKAVSIGQLGFTTALNILSNAIFSVDLAGFGSETAAEFKGLISRILEIGSAPNCADFFPVLKVFDPQGLCRRNSVVVGRMFGVFEKLMNERLICRERSGCGCFGDGLDGFLDACEDSGSGFNRSDIKHLLLDLFIAGTDTTSSSLEWAMTELLRNPKKLKKAQEELKQVIGVKGKQIEEEDLVRLPYLQAIIKETYRLHPATPLLLPRRALSTINLCGFAIPNNAQVFVNVWAMGRDEVLWKDPEAFEPERFLGSDIDVKGHDFELIPFGAGRRICPGLPLASRMLPCMLGSLLYLFDWKLENGIKPQKIDMDDKFGITLAKAKPLCVIPIKV